ncbi:PREDICTED: vegetative cell wall protein gp1-like [Chinchilla lanigera]|uniref:vegetative cell wall protein gp1-like n=1 Tax=Chinchilla lanigera TaxID=34839 RepID=UPI000695B5FB|nr:PREDICTED: vegetative cell wall protein gp1-like [Chinchilla lanigera]
MATQACNPTTLGDKMITKRDSPLTQPSPISRAAPHRRDQGGEAWSRTAGPGTGLAWGARGLRPQRILFGLRSPTSGATRDPPDYAQPYQSLPRRSSPTAARRSFPPSPALALPRPCLTPAQVSLALSDPRAALSSLTPTPAATSPKPCAAPAWPRSSLARPGPALPAAGRVPPGRWRLAPPAPPDRPPAGSSPQPRCPATAQHAGTAEEGDGRKRRRGRAGPETGKKGGRRLVAATVDSSLFGRNMSQCPDPGSPTLLPVRMRTHSSHFRGPEEVPPSLVPARPRALIRRTYPLGQPTGARRPGETHRAPLAACVFGACACSHTARPAPPCPAPPRFAHTSFPRPHRERRTLGPRTLYTPPHAGVSPARPVVTPRRPVAAPDSCGDRRYPRDGNFCPCPAALGPTPHLLRATAERATLPYPPPSPTSAQDSRRPKLPQTVTLSPGLPSGPGLLPLLRPPGPQALRSWRPQPKPLPQTPEPFDSDLALALGFPLPSPFPKDLSRDSGSRLGLHWDLGVPVEAVRGSLSCSVAGSVKFCFKCG